MSNKFIKSVIVFSVSLSLLMLVGWVKDISHLCKCDFIAPYKAEFFYAVGAALPPVGGIVGWFDLGK